MHALDDYYYFYLVVKYGGFSAASDATQITKSKLSRRIVELENKYQVQLLHRSTRNFTVTALGQAFFEECCKVLEQAECAENVLLGQKSEPQGLIRISCPEVMMHFQIRQFLNEFLKQYPKVELELELTSRRVDVIHDNIDLAIRTSFEANTDSNLIVRDVVKTSHCLVAHPSVISQYPLDSLEQLQCLPAIVLGTQKSHHQWRLTHKSSQENINIPVQARVKSNDLAGVYYAVKDGLGVADLPYLTVEADIATGQLIHLFPEWQSNLGTVQLVYASRKGQRLVMEKLIQVIVDGLRDMAKQHPGYEVL